MITSALHAGRAYIQGLVILIVSCLAFSQDFGFNSDSANASKSEKVIAMNTPVSTNHTPFDLNPTNEVEDILTISLIQTNSINTQNLNNLNSDEFLVVENNGEDLNYNALPVIVNLSSSLNSSIITEVSYKTIHRTWKIEEADIDIPTVKVQIPKDSIANNSFLGNYYMFISDTGEFDSTSDFRTMTLNENGNLETEYNFDGTTYITFGFSPQITEERSIYFNGTEAYIDMQNTLDLNPNGFTISAWVKGDTADTEEVSILSKRDVAFTQGYDFTLTEGKKVRISWKNDGDQSLTSYTSIPNDEWHHITAMYNGSRISIYIDGVLDNSATKNPPIATNESFFIAAAGKNNPSQHFKGHIDEVRIWNTDLSIEQLRFIMNQEIKNNSDRVVGKELPSSITKNEINILPWSNLAGYYPMSAFTYKNTIDASGNGNNGQLKNLTTVARETAPLPYTSKQDGDWNINSTWTNGTFQYTPGSRSIVNPDVTIDWNIVKTAHNLTLNNSSLPTVNNNNRTILGLFVEAKILTVTGKTSTQTGNGITVSHYLNLAGTIDLEGESQLIQTTESDLKIEYNGKIERDQQGTGDMFTYNYWSSPVTKQNSSVNSFKVSDVMKDGTSVSETLPINFSSSGYNGSPTQPISIADYWIWKYANQPSQNYSSWQHIRRTGTIFPGEGFTMKGPGLASTETQQNYTFSGKPNNGDINLALAPNNEYLVGNPYPSAIDADIFIRDNGPEFQNDNALNSSLISGTLYFWKHYGGDSHILQDYDGGYATYNFSGAVAAATKDSNNLNFNTNTSLSQKPGRYIPVGQGFFVVGENGGTINFNNGQRVFQKEDQNSPFMRNAVTSTTQKSNEDEAIDQRMKFRIGFNSINTIYRQLLLTIDENTTSGVDWAYDGKLNETQIDDMFWMINDEEYIIQASNEAEVSTIYPLGIRTDSDGLNRISIDALENVPNDINIYVHDIDLDLYHDLRESNYEIFLNAGEYLDRFEITFSNMADSLGIDDEIKDSIAILYSNDINKIVLINPNQIEVKSIALFNMLGQSVYTYNNIIQSDHSEYDVTDLSAGAYIIKLFTANNSVLTKKIVVD
ncbi:LamG-like jellyroll fold domain-containing protein [uncultured Winogradskyella sp.]|uniref:LamG-like jellyroll fold domain-containing protein n=1 Tax=uncultured Winogradskyella sp. TaxID=395353 RepID=UPI00260CB179|nr:LamG-like jellyroll fold domain-containing protein [uncultured Winogradskyella sp.]